MEPSATPDNVTHDWALLRSFAAVMRAGTLSAAAAVTGQTQPTVGRHIRALEQALGEALFERQGNMITPTQRAADLFEHAARMEEAAFALERAVAGAQEDVTGVVRLSVPEVFGVFVMPALIAQLGERHPALEIELVATNDTDDLHRRQADIAVRLHRPTQPDLVMTRVGAVTVGLFAAQHYLDRMGRPSTPADFAKHRMVGDDTTGRILRGMEAMGLTATRRDFRFRCDSILAQIAAVKAGTGIGSGLTLCFAEAGLVRLLPEDVNVGFDVYVVAHGDLHRSRKFRLVYDFLVLGLRDALRQAEQKG